jgi:hypothetical protein
MSMTADRCNSVRLPVFKKSFKSKGLAFAVSALLVAGASMPTPAVAFGIGFGGITIRIPGAGFGGGRGYRHHGGAVHHRHHDDEDNSDSADELTKEKPSDREAVSRQDINPKGSNPAISDPTASTASAVNGPSTASSPLKPVPALASDAPTTDAGVLNEHGPDFTPER